jgi:hypothetical protein
MIAPASQGVRRLDQVHPAIVYGSLAILMAALFVPISVFRLVDGDEGTYLLVSRLVAEGQVPYHDYFYPQMFLLPYVYGGWLKVVGYSWYAARALSACFSIALGLLLYRQVAHLTGARTWGVLAAVLFTFSGLAFGWYPLIKTFVLPTLLLFGAYTVVSVRSRWKWVVAGFLFGLSVACRVYVLAVIPAFLLEMYLTERDHRARLWQLVRFTIGAVVALIPAELFFLIDPATFIFNIVGAQLIRTDYQSESWWAQKMTQPLSLAIRYEGATSVQFLLLFLVNLASWVSSALTRGRLSLASSIGILLTLASFVPTPVYTQYFCMPLPFLLVNGVVFLAALTREAKSLRLQQVFASLTVLYILVSPFDFYRYTVGGEVPGIKGKADVVNWKLPTIRAVSRAIDREVPAGRPVAISLWPGYFVETNASILPGMENHFAMKFARRVTPLEVVQFKLMSYPELVWHVNSHTTDVVVVGNWMRWTPNSLRLRDRIIESGYVMKERIAGTEIYTLPANGRR